MLNENNLDYFCNLDKDLRNGSRFLRPIEEILQLIKDGNNHEFGIDRLKCLKKMLPDSNEVLHSSCLFFFLSIPSIRGHHVAS